MKKKICFLIAFLFAVQAVSLQYEKMNVANIVDNEEVVEFLNKVNNRNDEIHLQRYTESKKKIKVVFIDLIEKIKPVVHIKYKNVVSRVKFRVQSARMVVDDARYFYLKNTNTCSIIGTRDYVTLDGLFFKLKGAFTNGTGIQRINYRLT